MTDDEVLAMLKRMDALAVEIEQGTAVPEDETEYASLLDAADAWFAGDVDLRTERTGVAA